MYIQSLMIFILSKNNNLPKFMIEKITSNYNFRFITFFRSKHKIIFIYWMLLRFPLYCQSSKNETQIVSLSELLFVADQPTFALPFRLNQIDGIVISIISIIMIIKKIPLVKQPSCRLNIFHESKPIET